VGCTFAFLTKSEPPLLNMPFCGTEIFGQNSPQILFQWYPRHLSSPNAAEDTEYKFQLFEVRPAGRNINDVVLSSPPIYQTTTDFTQLVYGLAEPPLLDSMQYVWRVQAIDKTGRDAFRNQGYSQVCDFHYKLTGTAPPPPVVVGTPTDLTADALNKQTIKFEWGKVATDSFTVYSLEYRKVGVDSSSNPHSWFTKESMELTYTARDVEPATRYEARVRGKLGDTWGAYSTPVEVTTPADIPMQCGDDQQFPQADMSKPLGALLPQMTLVVRGMDVVVSEVTSGSNGQFTGRGKVITPYLGASFRVKFEDLYIDERLVVGAGKVEFLTQGMTNFINGQLANQEMRQLHRLQQANRLRFADLSFYGQIFTYQVEIKDVVVNGDGTVTIVDVNGNTIINNTIISLMAQNPDKAFLIQDKNGDQWVIKPDGTVEKAEGGGLPPVDISNVSNEVANIIKLAVQQLRITYDLNKINALANEITIKRDSVEYVNKIVAPIIPPSPSFDTTKVVSLYKKVRYSRVEMEESEFPSLYLPIAKRHKEAELNYNSALVLLVFLDSRYQNSDYKRMALLMEHEGIPLNSYIENALADSIAQQTIIDAVKQAFESMVKETVISIFDKK
jgi:hypothetical protein